MKERIKRAAKSAAARASGPAPKQVKLKLVHIEFWSAIKIGFLCTVAVAIAIIVGFFLVWLVASQSGVFAQVNNLLSGAGGASTVDVGSTLSLPRVMSFALALAFIQMVAGTLLSGVSALIFNVIGRITGGVAVGFTSSNS
jgi:hypothetical protein